MSLHLCQPFIFFIWRKHDEKFEPSDSYIFVKTPLYFLFYFSEIPDIFPYKTLDLEYVNFATPCIILRILYHIDRQQYLMQLWHIDYVTYLLKE
jgi:hypothetical protein